MSAENVEIAMTYMKFRNSYSHGFLKYYYFKRVISYCTGVVDGRRVRAIFQKLLDDEVIEKNYEYNSKGKTSLRYRFNPYSIEGLRFFEEGWADKKQETNINSKKQKNKILG